MRRVYFLTATRAEYDLMAAIMGAVDALPGFEVGVIVAGAHLSPFHGSSLEAIGADGFRVVGRLETLLSSESWAGRALSFGNLVTALTHLLSPDPPDMLFVAGDREEALAGALVGNLLRIHVAHHYGGDRCRASDVDEVFRPAISKLAHLHFTATNGHRARLIKMGEAPDTVHACGAAGLDRLRMVPDVSPDDLRARYGLDPTQPFFLMIHHPASTLHEAEQGAAEMRAILAGLRQTGQPVLCSYPNFDPGNVALREVLEAVQGPDLILYRNLPRADFAALYRRCAAILGNSSSIVIESTFMGVPGVLIGPRQDWRETSVNVLRIPATQEAVYEAAQRCLTDADWRARVAAAPQLYGDGHAAPCIASHLAAYDFAAEALLKTITY